MCGRYSLIADLAELAGRFEFDGDWEAFERRYNVAPTQEVLTVVGGEKRRVGFMRWGLIPHWTKDSKIGSRMINARAETVAEKPSFRNALRRRRCLVLADGVLRVAKGRKEQKAHEDRHAVGRAVRLRGTLGETWKDPEGTVIPSCTVITTTPNDLLKPIHNRMPVILSKEVEEFWLDDSVYDPTALTSVLTPYPDGAMEAYEVSSLVNSVANKGPEVIERVD